MGPRIRFGATSTRETFFPRKDFKLIFSQRRRKGVFVELAGMGHFGPSRHVAVEELLRE
jgi:hypothetical protein